MGRSSLDRFLDRAEQTRVVDAIRAAEARTSGEIKVHIEPVCKDKAPYDRAVQLFAQLGLHKTARRNAVLLYLASVDRKLAFIGDEAIHGIVGDDFWKQQSATLVDKLRAGAACDGIVATITAIGDRLAAAFPPDAQKVNQLSDDISTD